MAIPDRVDTLVNCKPWDCIGRFPVRVYRRGDVLVWNRDTGDYTIRHRLSPLVCQRIYHQVFTPAGRPLTKRGMEPLTPSSPPEWWEEEAKRLGLPVEDLRKQVALADSIIEEILAEEAAG